MVLAPIWGRMEFHFNVNMDSSPEANKKPAKKGNLKTSFPEIAAKTGLSEKDVAKVCRLLLKRITSSIENDELLQTKTLKIRSVLKPAQPANEKRGEIPERRIGRIIIKSDKKEDGQ